MTCISTLGLTLCCVNPTNLISLSALPIAHAVMFACLLFYVVCPQGRVTLAAKQTEVILCSVYYVIFSKITTLDYK